VPKRKVVPYVFNYLYINLVNLDIGKVNDLDFKVWKSENFEKSEKRPGHLSAAAAT
jgi:hypothetical protein